MKRNYLYFLLALCVGAVVMSCKPKNNPEDPKHPHLGDDELNAASYVGTVGMLDGHEAMVVDLGDGYGKIAITTMNFGATDPIKGQGNTEYADCYGSFWTQEEVLHASLGEWYLPSIQDMNKLVEHLSYDTVGDVMIYEWKVTDDASLYFPFAGYVDENGQTIDVGICGAFLTSNLEGDECSPMFLFAEDQGCTKVPKSCKASIRLFHKLPLTESCSDGIIGVLHGREAMNVTFGSHRYAVTTMNVGATHPTQGAGWAEAECYGDLWSWDDAMNAINNGEFGEGWRLPTVHEFHFFLSNFSYWRIAGNYVGYQWYVNNFNTLYMPAAGWENGAQGTDGEGYYWSCDLDSAYPVGAFCGYFNKDYADGYGNYPPKTKMRLRLIHPW